MLEKMNEIFFNSLLVNDKLRMDGESELKGIPHQNSVSERYEMSRLHISCRLLTDDSGQDGKEESEFPMLYVNPSWSPVKYWPTRYNIIIILMLSNALCYADRLNISVAIIPMAQYFGWNETQ